MKKHSFAFDSLTDFYTAIVNRSGSAHFNKKQKMDAKKWTGLSLAETKEYKYAYPLGIENLANFKNPDIEKLVSVKYWNQFDGFDIDIDRMNDGLDFLLDTHRTRRHPKTVDIIINIAENAEIGYNEMLVKSYTALKLIDHLESQGIRCSLTVAAISELHYQNSNNYSGHFCNVEVTIKNHHDDLNLGAICTAISPWFFRHWVLLFMHGQFLLESSVGWARSFNQFPYPPGCITIDSRQCLSMSEANTFITQNSSLVNQ